MTQVPFATLLPQCDGDVYDLGGAQIFDDSRYMAENERAPKFQIFVRGANHNLYNTYWSESDDSSSNAAFHCRQPDTDIDTLRMTAPDQRRNGAFLMESFMRYFVGGEIQFAPYWKGQAPIPPAGCPAGEDRCDERVALTIHQPAVNRKLLQNFQGIKSVTKNPIEMLSAFTNFLKTTLCRSLTEKPEACIDAPTRLASPSLFGLGKSYKNKIYKGETLLNWSVTDQAQLQWNVAGPEMTVDTGDLLTAGFDVLSFRISVQAPVGQEVEVSMKDTAGHSSTLKGSDFSDALYNIARKPNGTLPLVDAPEDAIYADDGTMRPLLNMVAVPLKAFALQGVDMAHIAQVRLRFPKASGSVAVTDVQLQRMD